MPYLKKRDKIRKQEENMFFEMKDHTEARGTIRVVKIEGFFSMTV